MSQRAMPMPTRPSLILSLALLPALWACSGAKPEAIATEPETSPLNAVVSHPGAPREQLADAVDALFADPQAGETRALLVLRNGRIVAERYGPGFGPDTRQIGWSMSKSVTGVLIGLLVADGRLRLDDPAPVPAWQRPGDPRGSITLRQLMQMRSGLHSNEAASPVYSASEVRMLFLDGRDNMAGWAEAQPLEAEPGTRWEYSTATSVILADLAARVLTDNNPDPATRRKAVSDYLHARLLAPLGLDSMVGEFDAAGTLAGGSMIHASARDWGKFGEFLRNGGAVKGAQIVPKGWIAFMTTPNPGNPAYGAQIWLNRPPLAGKNDELMAGQASSHLFACVGHLGQYVLVSPAQHLTLVRLGHSDISQRKAVRTHLAAIIRLFPPYPATS